MFQLIESQSREMKEVLSGGKVVWMPEKNSNEAISDVSFNGVAIGIGRRRYHGAFGKIENITSEFLNRYKNNTSLFAKDFRSIGTKREIFHLKNDIEFIGNTANGELRSYDNEFLEFVKRNRHETSITFLARTGGVILNQLPLLFANIVPRKVVA